MTKQEKVSKCFVQVSLKILILLLSSWKIHEKSKIELALAKKLLIDNALLQF